MAKAKANKVERVKMVAVKEVVKDGYTLTLTTEEADLLCSLLGWHIVGNPGGNRKLSDDIYGTLKDAGASDDVSLQTKQPQKQYIYLD